MDTLKCIAVDDEPLALMQLSKYIERTPGMELVSSCYDARECIAELDKRDDVDLIFLDINMPDMSGLELARKLSPGRPMVIFTTAYSEYAIEGFKVEAVDYLMKPFGYEEFTESIERARRRHRLQNEMSEVEDGIYVKDSGVMRRILLSDITMIKGLAEYVQIYLKAVAHPITTLMSLRSLEERLPSERFMRIHRSYIVNLDAVEGVEHNKVKIGGEMLPISESYRGKFREYLSGKMI